ncbi:hypothetical protein DVH05_017515 [Phytophthora capsici]|nr:hypothetical protein DVH05_017515 [Phytophthora capsici]
MVSTEQQTSAVARVNTVLAGMKKNTEERDHGRAEIYVATVRPGLMTKSYQRTTTDEAAHETKEDEANAEAARRTSQIMNATTVMNKADAGPTRTTPNQDVCVVESGEGAEIPNVPTSVTKEVRRQLTMQRRLARRDARKEARQRRQTKLRTEREAATKAEAERTRNALELRLKRIKGAVDGIHALQERRAQRKAAQTASEDKGRLKPVSVRLVKRTKSNTDQLESSDDATKMTVSSDDGLPTAKVEVNGIWHGIKLDSCARYTIAGTDWMKHVDRIEGEAPIDYVEGIGGFLLDVVGVWRF